MISAKQIGPLLIVDDRADVRAALSRLFRLYFDVVLAAGDPTEAEAILERERPRLLLCDYWLGDQYPLGTRLIAQWRTRFQCVERAALMTGTNASAIEPSSAADAIFAKPLDLGRVIQFLQGAEQ